MDVALDVFLAILSGILILTGVLGSVFPVIPGPPIAWGGLLILKFTSYSEMSWNVIIVMAILMVLITVLDVMIPIWGTKKFGGTKAGIRGSTIGLVVGLFFGPLGIILGPFLGAFIGELMVNRENTKGAFKSALGSFLGFLLGTGLKLVYGGFAIWFFVEDVFL